MKIKKYKDYDNYKEIQIQRTKEKLKQNNINKHRLVFNWGFSTLNIDKGAKILCVGARTGNEIVALEELGFKNIVGTDLYPNKNIIYDDMNDMQFKDNSFDLLYSHHSLEHTVYPERAATEMKRVVKPGGFIFIVVPIMDSKRYYECVTYSSPIEIKELFNLSILKAVFLKYNTESNNNPEYRAVFKGG